MSTPYYQFAELQQLYFHLASFSLAFCKWTLSDSVWPVQISKAVESFRRHFPSYNIRLWSIEGFFNIFQPLACGSVASRMLASAREDPAAYHPACWQLQEKMRQRTIPHVGKCQRRCGSGCPAAYHPACWQVQKKMRQRTIPHAGKCKRRCGTGWPAAYHTACWQVQEKMRQRTIPHVGKCKKRCGSVTSRMLAGAREDASA